MSLINLKKHLVCLVSALTVGAAFLASSCSEDIDMSARYVFKERTIASYLVDHEQFSEYVRLLKEQPVSSISNTSVYQLMTAYGYYTCFAPTNDAIRRYMEDLVKKEILPEPSWDAFPDEHTKDSIRRVIVLNSILDGTQQKKSYFTAEFPKAKEEFGINTMADRKLSVTYGLTDPDSLYIDGISPLSLTNRDIETINGFIHEVGYVINPSDETLGSTLRKFLTDEKCGYSVMARLVEACGLFDTLMKVKDEEYEYLYQTGSFPIFHWNLLNTDVQSPEHRKYGFTLFAPVDTYWEGVLEKPRTDITVADVVEWLKDQNFYPEANLSQTSYRAEDNLLNLFVTYHLLPERLPVDKLVIHAKEKGYNYKNMAAKPTIPVWAHYTTMGKRRLLRLWESAESLLESGETKGVYLNRFPVLDTKGSYHELSCADDCKGELVHTGEESGLINLINAMIYPIDRPVAYTDHVRDNLAKQRLRYDVFEMAPEAMNNDLRMMRELPKGRRYFSSEPQWQYFENITVNSKETNFMILNGIDEDWPNYQCDELLAEGLYDITVKVPPVPRKGTYEIRMGVSTYSSTRGICQVYFGTRKNSLIPQGIPVNMQLGGQDPMLGWVKDIDDEETNAINDKQMRANDFMKGPEYITGNPGGVTTNRASQGSTRRIIVRQEMSPDEVYYLRFKTVQDYREKQLFVDYLEWCPKEIYDNPNEPEDIW